MSGVRDGCEPEVVDPRRRRLAHRVDLAAAGHPATWAVVHATRGIIVGEAPTIDDARGIVEDLMFGRFGTPEEAVAAYRAKRLAP